MTRHTPRATDHTRDEPHAALPRASPTAYPFPYAEPRLSLQAALHFPRASHSERPSHQLSTAEACCTRPEKQADRTARQQRSHTGALDDDSMRLISRDEAE